MRYVGAQFVKAILAVLFVSMGTKGLAGQGPTIKVDLLASSFDAAPPFDRPFVLRVAVPDGVEKLRFEWGPVDRNAEKIARRPSGYSERSVSGVITRKEVVFAMPPLPANVPYLFTFILRAPNGATETVLIEQAANSSLKHRLHTDVGLIWTNARQLEYWGAGSNVHFYAMPVDPEMETDSLAGLEKILKRVSLFVGLSAKLHAGKPFESLLSTGTPVVGIGLWPMSNALPSALRNFRLNFGMIWFEQESANPLVDSRATKHAPVVTVTFNTSLQPALLPLATLLGLGK